MSVSNTIIDGEMFLSTCASAYDSTRHLGSKNLLIDRSAGDVSHISHIYIRATLCDFSTLCPVAWFGSGCLLGRSKYLVKGSSNLWFQDLNLL